MNSSARARRVLRAAPEHDDVYVLGEGAHETAPLQGTVATVQDMLAAAARKAEAVVAEARRQAEQIVAEARANADAVRQAATQQGFQAGQAEAIEEVKGALDLVRHAAREAKAVRDDIASQSGAVVARATGLALRRVVGEYYEAEPERTAIACAEALRAVAGQEILSIRVNPGLVSRVQARLTDAAGYVRPDASVEIGGCIIDLRHGTLDATLDARLSLMDLALAEAAGEFES